MQDLLIILIAGIFLPLFPMSMIFGAIFDNIKYCGIRALLILVWPLIGITILLISNPEMPDWLFILVLSTSFLYALRMLTLREVNQWSGFLGVSLWSLLWLSIMQDVSPELIYWFAISMSIPLVLLVMLSKGLEKRYGAAYTDLYGGLARTIPRFSGVFVLVVVAAIATPLFPSFFILLDMIVETVRNKPVAAIVILLNWLLWSWAGARLIQGLIVGRISKIKIPDMGINTIAFYSIVMITLIGSGIYLSGIIL